MTDLSDLNMTGVTAAGADSKKLVAGQYLIRFEKAEKTKVQDKFDEHGAKMPESFYELIGQKVYGGPDDGHMEEERLNLWNQNETTVRMAKIQLRSMFDAAGLGAHFNPDGSAKQGTTTKLLLNKWAILEKRPGTGKYADRLFSHYTPAPAEAAASFKVEPIVEAAHAQHAPANPNVATVVTTTAPNPNAIPAWMAKKS